MAAKYWQFEDVGTTDIFLLETPVKLINELREFASLPDNWNNH
jgi:hypothetical protein